MVTKTLPGLPGSPGKGMFCSSFISKVIEMFEEACLAILVLYLTRRQNLHEFH